MGLDVVKQRLAVEKMEKMDGLDLCWKVIMSYQPSKFQDIDGGILSPSLLCNIQRGTVWQCNKCQCGWQGSCKFKHECSGCGGLHLITRCFKQMAREKREQGS